MKTAVVVLSAAGLAAMSLVAVAAEKKAAAPAEKKTAPASAPAASAPAEMPPLPKPGPEQDVLKAQEGVWDATVETWMAPGQPAMTSKGTQTNTMLGGLWLLTDFKSSFMGMPFSGHGVEGWDSGKKKYVSTWVDSTSPGLSLGESDYDAATKTMTGWMEGPGMDGKVTKMKETAVFKDPDTSVFTMSAVGSDGKDVPVMRITYTRRK